MSKFDLAQTQILAGLLAVAPDKRDEQWLQRFYAAVPDASLVAGNPQVEQGPDGFPYFQLAMPDPGSFTPFCVTHVLDNCLQHGMGIALFDNARRNGEPAWVFTYGSLLSFKLYGAFDGDPNEPRSSGAAPEAASDESRKVLTGAPSESFLPAYARKAMGDFFRRALHRKNVQRHALPFELKDFIQDERFRQTWKHLHDVSDRVSSWGRGFHETGSARSGAASNSWASAGNRSKPLKFRTERALTGGKGRAIHPDKASGVNCSNSSISIRPSLRSRSARMICSRRGRVRGTIRARFSKERTSQTVL